MNIAVFYHLPFGGAKRVVGEHVGGLIALGHVVDVYSINREEDMFDPNAVSTNSYNFSFITSSLSIPLLGRLIKDLQIFTSLRSLHKKIAKEIDAREYDVVLVHTDTYTQSPYLLHYLKTNNVYFCLEPLRIVYEYSLRIPASLHGLNKVYEIITRHIRKRIDRANARSAKHSLALSYFGREYMIHAYNLYPKISYLGVNEKLFKSTGAKRKKQILFVAEKEYIYGYDLAKKALELIPKSKRPELKMVFGTKRTQRITDQELVQMYSESIATLSLSRYDTFGLVPLESMACNTPVIALNVAGYRETIINDKNGYLVDFDPQEIADRIEYLIDNPEEVERLGKEGRRWVTDRWTWGIQVNNLEKLLGSYVS